jgi:hypothetical protein
MLRGLADRDGGSVEEFFSRKNILYPATYMVRKEV